MAEQQQRGARVAPGDGAATAPEAQETPGARTAAATDGPDELEEQAERSSNAVSIIVIISRVTGFFRTTLQAWALGAGGIASAYTVANNLPNTLYELVMGGMLVTAFLPVYLNVKKRAGREGANEYTSNLLSIVGIFLAIVCVLCMVCASPIIWTQSVGADEAFETELAVWLFRWFACEILLYALSSLFSGALNAEREYIWSNAAPIFNNMITILSFVLYGYLVEYAGVAWNTAAIVLAIGNPLGVLVQVLVQMPSMRKRGIRLRLHVDLSDPALRETLSIGLPTLVVTFASTITTTVMSSSSLAATASGASISYYARVWYVLPYSIFAVPISVTMFTELSECFSQGALAKFKEYFANGVRKLFFTLIPFTMYLIVFAPCLVAVFASGRFDEEAVELTVGYLRTLALALPFHGLCTYLQKTCSAMLKMRFYALATCLAAAAQVLICVVCTPVFGLNAVAFSTVVFYGAIDLVTILNLRRELGRLGLGSVVRATGRALVFGLAGSLVGQLVLNGLAVLAGPCEGALRGVLYAAAGGIPALLVTFGIAYLMGMSDAPFFDALFGRAERVAKRLLGRA